MKCTNGYHRSLPVPTGIARMASAVLLVMMMAACRDSEEGQRAGASEEPTAEITERLVSSTAGIDQVLALPRDPEVDPLPEDEHTAEMVKLGYKIVRNSQQHAGDYVGNRMNCASCHMNAGQRDRALPYVGVAATFPQYRARDGRMISLDDRIGDCFERSMNGTRPAPDSEVNLAVAAYISWLSEGQPMGESPPWRGQNVIPAENRIPIDQLDVARGEEGYRMYCTACHGADGQGIPIGGVVPGPLWGPDSWNDGAGAARIYTLAGYLRHAMPLTAPGMLSDEDVQHIAAFINSHERPSFARKTSDFPNGDVPIDAVYYPQRYDRNPLRR